MTDKPDATHYLAIVSDEPTGRRGEVRLELVCTAAAGARCRLRPPDDPDLIDGECWAVEWVAEGGWETVATDHAELARIPVAVECDEGVLVAPVAPHPTLPAAVAALRAVLGLHRPVEVEPSDTLCGECSFQLPNGRYFGKVVEWPCPTVAAIEAALWDESRPTTIARPEATIRETRKP